MPGDRPAALEWAADVRQARADLRAELREGRRGLGEVLNEDADDELRGVAWVLWVLESRPGVRKIDTRRQLDSIGIDPSTELAGLDAGQVELLIEHFAEVES